VVTGSITPTGIPMPFISAGGTSLSVFMGAIGILCNVGKCKENSEEFKKSMLEINLFKNKKKKENKI
jgi:cell division protein FtsW (lipid II flippase)